MRILLFTFEFPPRWGGMQEMGYQLAHHLHEQGHAILVLTAPQEGDLPFDAAQPFPIRRVGEPIAADRASVWHKVATKWRTFRAFRRAALDFRPDAILCTYWDPSGYLSWLFSLGRRIPFFLVGHGTELHHLSARGPARWLKVGLRRLTFSQARAVFAVSRFTAQKVQGLGLPASKVFVVPNGVNLSNGLSPAPPDKPPAAPRLLTVCRLVPRKGVDTVIRALPALVGEFPGLRYTIAGDGPMRADLMQLAAELGLSDCVVFLGKVSEAQKQHLYHTSDLFLMPARQTETDYEGFGIVFLEAMSYRLPVIGASTGGIPDVIEPDVTGLLVPPDDPTALSHAIRRLLNDPDLRAGLAAKALERIHERFRWETVVGQYADIMGRLRE